MSNTWLRNLCYFTLFIALAVISYIILRDANWILGDDYQFLSTTMIGKPCHGWFGYGRFWPLGLVDYSILLFIPHGQTIIGHFVYNIVIMTVSVVTLFHFMNKSNGKNYGISLFCIFVLFSLTSFIRIHMNCIYAERFMFFLQVLFMYFWWKAKQKQSISYYFVSWLSATYTIFCKEPFFGAIIVIALTNLIFGRKSLSRLDKKFQISLLISGVLYLLIYFCMYYFNKESIPYLYEKAKWIFTLSNDEILNTITNLFFAAPLLVIIFVICCVRAYCILIKRDKKNLFLDSLLFAGAAYAIAYMLLPLTKYKMIPSYYVFPGIVFCMPGFSYWIAHFWNTEKTKAVLLIFITVYVQIPSLMAYEHIVSTISASRKQDMMVIDEICKAYIQGKTIYFFTQGKPLTMFRPGTVYSNVWEFDCFNGFLNFVLKKKYHLDKKNILIPLESLNDATKNCLVLSLMNIDKEDENYLLDTGFHLLTKVFQTKIYCR